MPLASLEDINTHLPDDKIKVGEAEVGLFQVDAQRIIKGYLSGVFTPATLAGWADPEETDETTTGYVPQTIRAIAGRLIAAAHYKERYAEDVESVPAYAQDLYNTGIAMLNDVMTGRITLIDVTEQTTVGGTLRSDDFWPNDSTDGPMFTTDQIFA